MPAGLLPGRQLEGTSINLFFKRSCEIGAQKIGFFERSADAELAGPPGCVCFQPRRTVRSSCGGHPFERCQPSHIVGEVLQADLEACRHGVRLPDCRCQSALSAAPRPSLRGEGRWSRLRRDKWSEEALASRGIRPR